MNIAFVNIAFVNYHLVCLRRSADLLFLAALLSFQYSSFLSAIVTTAFFSARPACLIAAFLVHRCAARDASCLASALFLDARLCLMRRASSALLNQCRVDLVLLQLLSVKIIWIYKSAKSIRGKLRKHVYVTRLHY